MRKISAQRYGYRLGLALHIGDKNMKLRYWIEDGAYAPEKAHKEDAGFDLRTPVFVTIEPHKAVTIDTGVHVEIPYGYVGMIKTKSGLNVKDGLNTEGVIDCGYDGSIRVKIYNHSDSSKSFDKGMKITQLVVLPIPEIELVEEYFKSDSDRGSNGFGSTGA